MCFSAIWSHFAVVSSWLWHYTYVYSNSKCRFISSLKHCNPKSNQEKCYLVMQCDWAPWKKIHNWSFYINKQRILNISEKRNRWMDVSKTETFWALFSCSCFVSCSTNTVAMHLRSFGYSLDFWLQTTLLGWVGCGNCGCVYAEQVSVTLTLVLGWNYTYVSVCLDYLSSPTLKQKA